MYAKEKTNTNLLVLSLVIVITSWVLGYLYLNYEFNKSTKQQLELIDESVNNFFIVKTVETDQTLKIMLHDILLDESLAQAIAEQEHEQIAKIVNYSYTNLKKQFEDIQILTFRTPDGVTLYRAHRPEFYGDNLNQKRTLIVDTSTRQTSFSGFNVSKLQIAYRTTQAIFYNHKFVGTVELGVSPRMFIKDLNHIFHIDIGIAIDKKLANIMISEKHVSINSDYTLVRGSDRLMKFFTHKTKPDDFIVKMDIPLNDHLDDSVGYLVVGLDTSSIIKKNKNFMYEILFFWMLISLVLVLISQISFKKVLKQFSKSVYTDQLTRLGNREALKSKLDLKDKYVLIVSNIKGFALLNELYGTNNGNEVLRQVAKAFEIFALSNGFVAYRASSDEFILLKKADVFEIEEYVDILEELHEYINKLEIKIDKINEIINVEINSGISFGNKDALENSQMALKNARNKSLPYLAYSKNIDTKKNSEHIMKIKKTIRKALENKEVVPFFQPIVDRDVSIVKYEALIRIVETVDGVQKITYPDDFLPVAMQNGLYQSVAKEMLVKALETFLPRKDKISINFLPRDFFSVVLMDCLKEYIEKYDSPNRIVIEITEQEDIEDFDRLVKVIKHLRKFGVLIAIDDFGSGYANYGHIMKIKPDYLKIDASLVKNILTDDESRILVKSIIDFTKSLGIKTIAEYIENEEIFELLKDYGVDEFQGYYFGRPNISLVE